VTDFQLDQNRPSDSDLFSILVSVHLEKITTGNYITEEFMFLGMKSIGFSKDDSVALYKYCLDALYLLRKDEKVILTNVGVDATIDIYTDPKNDFDLSTGVVVQDASSIDPYPKPSMN